MTRRADGSRSPGLPADVQNVLWINDLPRPENRLASDTVADVAIIGGGFTGLAAAYFIKSRAPHVHVVLLESQFCGYGASGRNAGMALSQAGVDPGVLERLLGTAGARQTLARLGRGIELMEQLSSRHHYEGAIERTGSIALGRTAGHAREHRQAVAVYRRLGLEAEVLDRAAVRREVDSPLYNSGFHVPATTALVDPWKVVRGLRRAALDAGVHIHEDSPVLRVHQGPEHRIVCGAGTVRAPVMVLATNGYSSHLGFFRNRVAPVHVSCIATEPLSPAIRRSLGWQSRQSAWEEGWLYHFFRLTPDDRVLIGGGWAVYRMGDRLDYPGAAGTYRRLERALRRIFPQLEPVAITHRWSGPVGFTRDFLPSIGVTGEHRNVLYAVGYSGHGVAMSHLAGEMLADRFAGVVPDDADLFLVDRPFKTLLADPFKWMVITAVRNGYLMLDRLGF